KIVSRVFQDVGYDVRCRFVGSRGVSTEKADFAIPSKRDPGILIESKAYGATGSKQTDILGEMSRIVEEKRHDTHLLLVTDGITWRSRVNDLRKLVTLQNEGKIARIYTQRWPQNSKATFANCGRITICKSSFEKTRVGLIKLALSMQLESQRQVHHCPRTYA